MSRYASFVDALRTATLDSPARLAPAVRAAIARQDRDAIPAALRTYVEKVALHASTVTDADVAALKAAGFTEDEIFEATGAAAVGAALSRLERGMAVLRQSRPSTETP